MDWENDLWRKVYHLPEPTQIVLGWEACFLLFKLWMAVDRAGILELPADDDDMRVALLADSLRVPRNVADVGLDRLTRRQVVDGVPWVEIHGDSIVLPWFMASQEARTSDRARQKRRREKRVAAKRHGEQRVTERDADVTPRDSESQNVTRDPDICPVVEVGLDTPLETTEVQGPLQSVTFRDGMQSRAVTHPYPKEKNRREESRREQTELICASEGGFDFEGVYASYPLKRGRAGGLKAIRKQVTTAADFDRFRRAVETMGEAWKGHDLKFCPMFSTFVNQRYWADEELPLPLGSPSNGARHTHFAEAPDRSAFDDAADDDIPFEGR